MLNGAYSIVPKAYELNRFLEDLVEPLEGKEEPEDWLSEKFSTTSKFFVTKPIIQSDTVKSEQEQSSANDVINADLESTDDFFISNAPKSGVRILFFYKLYIMEIPL